MLNLIIRSSVMTVVLAVILCGVYPLGIFVVGKVLFPGATSGSLVQDKSGKIVGSRLIGQSFSRPEYFHGRPSAAGEKGYDATSSSGTNLGPTSQKLAKAVEDNVKRVLSENPQLKPGEVPVDLVTASASGLDPHISPRGAEVQVPRIAKARNIPEDQVRNLVKEATGGPALGILGESAVNVLALNLRLDEIAPITKP